MTMKSAIPALFLLTLLAASCAPVSSAPTTNSKDKLAAILARGTLVIATDADYPPQSKLIKGSLPSQNTKCTPTQYTADQMEGFDVDVAKEIAQNLSVEPCFVTPPWSQIIAGNWQDNWDIHVGSAAITFERMKALYFSQPYYATPTVVLVHKDNTSIKTVSDLSGKRVGICAGCITEPYLKNELKLPGQEIQYLIQNARVIAYENEAPAINDLAEGNGLILDGVLTLLPVARASIENGLPLRMLDAPLFFAYASVTVDRISSRNPARLLEEISRIVMDLHKSGTLKELSIQYMGSDLTQEAAAFDLSKIDQKP